MTQPFAKLFQHEKYGQILVLLDQDDEGDPAVKFMACPPNLGICTTTLGFEQTERAEEAFHKTDIEMAVKGIADMWSFGEGIA